MASVDAPAGSRMDPFLSVILPQSLLFECAGRRVFLLASNLMKPTE